MRRSSNSCRRLFLCSHILGVVVLTLFSVLAAAISASAETDPEAEAARLKQDAPEGYRSIDEVWSNANAPWALALEHVRLDPTRTALLVLDMHLPACSPKQRPRCAASAQRIQLLLGGARKAGVTVVFSLAPGGKKEDILPALGPESDEAVVRSDADKFWKTDLEETLRDEGVDTLIITGTPAHGAVLHTAGAARARGFHVVLPTDGLSAETLYQEQAAVSLLTTGGESVRITRCEMIDFLR